MTNGRHCDSDVVLEAAALARDRFFACLGLDSASSAWCLGLTSVTNQAPRPRPRPHRDSVGPVDVCKV